MHISLSQRLSARIESIFSYLSTFTLSISKDQYLNALYVTGDFGYDYKKDKQKNSNCILLHVRLNCCWDCCRMVKSSRSFENLCYKKSRQQVVYKERDCFYFLLFTLAVNTFLHLPSIPCSEKLCSPKCHLPKLWLQQQPCMYADTVCVPLNTWDRSMHWNVAGMLCASETVWTPAVNLVRNSIPIMSSPALSLR